MGQNLSVASQNVPVYVQDFLVNLPDFLLCPRGMHKDEGSDPTFIKQPVPVEIIPLDPILSDNGDVIVHPFTTPKERKEEEKKIIYYFFEGLEHQSSTSSYHTISASDIESAYRESSICLGLEPPIMIQVTPIKQKYLERRDAKITFFVPFQEDRDDKSYMLYYCIEDTQPSPSTPSIHARPSSVPSAASGSRVDASSNDNSARHPDNNNSAAQPADLTINSYGAPTLQERQLRKLRATDIRITTFTSVGLERLPYPLSVDSPVRPGYIYVHRHGKDASHCTLQVWIVGEDRQWMPAVAGMCHPVHHERQLSIKSTKHRYEASWVTAKTYSTYGSSARRSQGNSNVHA
ncbi:hypothetical protein PLICRDRAFT_39114 [Plicaturopsis crispa FD-325 SS-3]|nr:hypothetical protein PLICRDRAFT_39114 [Plicaturopsis crispa FD-325 SS-3]